MLKQLIADNRAFVRQSHQMALATYATALVSYHRLIVAIGTDFTDGNQLEAAKLAAAVARAAARAGQRDMARNYARHCLEHAGKLRELQLNSMPLLKVINGDFDAKQPHAIRALGLSRLRNQLEVLHQANNYADDCAGYR